MVWSEGLPSGRERAIESLIDREPQGAFYRAGRVLDEVVPQALVNRPNIVTKGALVEQAYALVDHEIKLSNYDDSSNAAMASTSSASSHTASGSVPLSLASTSKERILKHHGKQCSVLQQQRKKSNKNATISSTPSPQLVAALRQVYGTSGDEASSSFNFPSLLKAVMDHKVFEATENTTNSNSSTTATNSSAAATPFTSSSIATEGGSSDSKPSGDAQPLTSVGTKPNTAVTKSSKEGGKSPVAQIESLIANVCRLANQSDQTHISIVQGLLVAALSILTQTPASPNNDAETEEDSKKNKGDDTSNKGGEGSKPNKKTLAEDPTASPALPVGSLLSLLKLDDSNNSKNEGYQLEQDLVDYFGQAAVAYERRIEIQKARLLAKLQQDGVETSPFNSRLRAAELISDVPAAGSRGEDTPPSPVALTRTQGDTAATTTESNNSVNNSNNTSNNDINAAELTNRITADQVDILQADAANQLERLAQATLAGAATLEQIISSGATGDETSSGGDVSSGSGSGNDSGSDPDEEIDAGVGASIIENHANTTSSGGEEHEGASPATDDEAQGENDSSSSSSADDWGMMDGRTGAGGEDGGVNEEDDDVLQQALALSLSEHNRTQAEIAAHESQGQSEEQEHEEAADDASSYPTNDAAGATRAKESEATEAQAHTAEPIKNECDVKADESSLPALPPKPCVYPYATLLGHPFEVDSDQSVSIESVLEPYLDPSILTKFGSIPTANVLVHLLRYTAGIIEKNKFVTSQTNQPRSSAGGNHSFVPGGIGISLFSPGHQRGESNRGRDGVPGNSQIPVTLQLLVALFLHTIEKRSGAVAGLRKALAHEERHEKGEDISDESATGTEDAKSDNSPLSSEEEDDPAIALAMNYVEDYVAESSESLEAKGMRRKAAAAAHDAAALLSLLRRRTDSWKQNVKLYSLCAVYAMKSLRLFLQSMVRQRLQELESQSFSALSVNHCSEFLPSLVGSKVSMSLASLLSVSGHNASATLWNDHQDEVNDVFMPLELYKEAVTTWGECIPLVYPAANAQVEVLRNLILECSTRSGVETLPHFRTLDSLSVMPTSEMEPQVHRLQCLCRRLRTADLLNNFVPRPVRFVSDGKSRGSGDFDNDAAENEVAIELGKKSDPFHSSAIVSLIASNAKDVCGGKGELQRLFLALCHRFHSRVLLWGGLYESAESDMDDVAGGTVAQSPVSSGDLVRIGANPSTNLQFDATKCSDSIAILANHGESSSGANGSSVHQRASKVWGSVLSTNHYNPKTGVHRWVVRLDKCERGHVFVGVATAQASMRTYVGGDKYGWGMIGTQALWHDRRKIRGDYGATFRTGSTIIVTLDTDAGTLSFSSWKDSSSSSSFSLDPLLQNQSTARRQGQIGGTVEDWGIAFEGLPLDSRLYPAVGLYQRDDRVTLLTVESSRNSNRDGGVDITGGCYFPQPDPVGGARRSAAIAQVRRFNETLSWEGIQYILEALQYILVCLESSKDEFVLATLLPSLSAALCLVPSSIPILSKRFALTLLPHLSKFLLKLDHYRGERQRVHRLFRTGMRPGKWIIRATGSSGENSDNEEYVVDFTSAANEQGLSIGFEGTGVGTTGKSKNGLVAIFGTTKGSSVHFVEEWSDGSDEGFGSSATPDETSSCVVAARISLDGTKFEGSYRNVQYGTTGQIAGILQPDNSPLTIFRLKDAPASSKQSAELADGIVTGEAVLCLAYNHMATIIGEDAAGDQQHAADSMAGGRGSQTALLKGLVSGQLFCGSSLGPSDRFFARPLETLKHQYSWENTFEDPHECRNPILLESAGLEKSFSNESAVAETSLQQEEVEKLVRELDDQLAKQCGGKGSLRCLCPNEYDEARNKIICAFIRPCDLYKELSGVSDGAWQHLQAIWQAALKIMEDGLREALSNPSPTQTKKVSCIDRCILYKEIAAFLVSLEFYEKITIAVAAREISNVFKIVKSKMDLDLLRKEMEAGSRRSLLRLISAQEVVGLLADLETAGRDVDNFVVLEALVIGLPRLLGRHPVDSFIRMRKQSLNKQNSSKESSNNLGSAGCSRSMRLALRNHVHKLLQLLGRVATKALVRRSQVASGETRIPVDSLLLALLTVFTVTLKGESIDEMVSKSGIIGIITELLAEHRESMSTCTISMGDDKSSVVKKLQAVCQREISRSILHACVAASHALIFQTSHRTVSKAFGIEGTTTEAESESTALCLQLLFGELKEMFESAEKIVAEAMTVATSRRADGDWEKWCDAACSSCRTQHLEKAGSHQLGSAGLLYLQENGTTHISGLATSHRPSSRQKQPSTASSRASSDGLVKLSVGFAFQLLSQWLHILCGILYSPQLISVLSREPKWISLLLWAVGLSTVIIEDGSIDTVEVREEQTGLLPARLRSRILRFLLPLLDAMEPNENIVVGLLSLAGKGSLLMPRALEEDDRFSSREAVTLLRQLHSPTRPGWRESVNRAISSCSQSSKQGPNELVLMLGVLSFLSGSLEMIGRGSYVLLKPAAAVPLSLDQQSSPSSKGHSGGVGGTGSGIGATPHHIVGNGTEGIVAGLCRHDASAGLVSNIDLTNGICEVVLLTRDPHDPEESGDTLLLSKPPSGCPRHTLTVRALRTALSDVVHAQEAPLYLDETMTFDTLFVSVMGPALTTLFTVMKPKASLGLLGSSPCNENEGSEVKPETFELFRLRSGLMNVSIAIMLLRSAIVLLSDKRIASTFFRNSSSREILSNVLRLAWPAEMEEDHVSDFVRQAQRSFLSSLPVHEARYGHLVSLLSELSLRDEALGFISEEKWDLRLEELRIRRENIQKENSKGTPVASGNSQEQNPSSGSDSAAVDAQASGGSATASANAESDTGARSEETGNRAVSQSTMSSNSEEEEESEAAATVAAHLREAAIAQMAELGLPRSWSELALRRTGGNDIEAAVHFCLERGGEMERLLAEERERERLMQRQAGGGQSSRRRGYRNESGSSNHLLRQLLEMGFPSRWCAEALAATGNNVDEALTWILTHGERLSEEDEAMDDEDDGEDVDDEDDDDDEEDEDDEDEAGNSVVGADGSEEAGASPKSGSIGCDNGPDTVWSGSVVPLRFISGRSIIDSKTLAISGLPTGGFSSVGTKGILLCSGKWYYEAILETAGCLQIGWADGSFAGHCHADRGDGTGDGPSSWAFDGWRRYRWHSTATEWGCRWKEGDVVGCMVDMDAKIVSFHLNGRGEEIGMGVAFSGEGFRPCGGVYACVSFNRREKLRLRLSKPFKYQPPPGYQGVGSAVLESVKEREQLARKEQILDRSPSPRSEPKKFLCDFSDGEHGHELMAWAHRYYGSDASVHLGSGRSKPTSSVQKCSSPPMTDSPTGICVTRRVEKFWSKSGIDPGDEAKSRKEVLSKIKKGYVEVSKKLDGQILNESVVLTILYARKLILHLIVTMGEDFDLGFFFKEAEANNVARQFWGIIESCASLRCAGWVGEAGAMAIAAEALGLGISSNDHGHSRQSTSERPGIAPAYDLDEGVLLAAGGITQLLSSVMRSNVESTAMETGSSLTACAEAAIGSDGGGGVLVFLQKGLQSAVERSHELRCVLTAAVQRSIRLLAVVEYEGDDSDVSDQAEDDADPDRSPSSPEKKALAQKGVDSDSQDVLFLPDARLTSFLTGLLMSKPVEAAVSEQGFRAVVKGLFQAWSIGMLSASLPWRMVCAFTVAGILNKCPEALAEAVSTFPTLARFYGRLESTVSRRVWAERASVPVCSRYVQAMVELLAAVQRSVALFEMSPEFMKLWGKISVDAATPLHAGITCVPKLSSNAYWESDDGWISSDTSWEVWTGTVEYMPVDWETPSRSPVRSLMDGGEGPPMLREGCYVMRGLDWSNEGSGSLDCDDDGKNLYESEKAKRDKEKCKAEAETEEAGGDATADDKSHDSAADPTSEQAPHDPVTDDDPSGTAEAATAQSGAMQKKKQKKKISSPKLPAGTVLSIEPWKGQPGLGRKVRWHLTGKVGVYRFGGDGGRYDISHVEINERSTRVKKRHPLPESSEQCAGRHGFGAHKKYCVILRLQRCGSPGDSGDERRTGVLEWPDFGAGVLVDCILHSDCAITLTEKQLIYGSKDAGWEARFGQPSFVPGACFVLSPTSASSVATSEVNTKSPYLSFYEELLGSTSYQASALRNRADGSQVHVISEMRLFRGRQRDRTQSVPKIGPVEAPIPPPFHFDREYHAGSLSLSRDGRTVSCVASDGRGAAYASVGFTKGVHYWEVKLEQADIGSVFIGVAEKPNSSGSGASYDTPPRLNRWPGWGFVNFRATYSSGAERVYGAHCHAGDTVGVLLDCDAGRISFFFDGLKYGEHILNDLGCAFENLSPFGFNVDGCGSGGAGQGAPSGIEGGRGGRYPAQGSVRPRALWPVIGLRNQGDRVTISPKWTTSYGVDGIASTRNALAVDEILFKYAGSSKASDQNAHNKEFLPEWFVNEAFTEYNRWHSGKWKRTITRGSGPYRQTSFGLDIDVDASPIACATASAALGLKHAFLAGDRVRLLRSAGRILELAEEALILGAFQGRLFYQIVSQKSEGGSLTEGGGRAWFLDESEVVDGLPCVGRGKAEDIELPLMDRFKCRAPGGLKIAYDGGAVVRSDLEIIDGSMNLGVIPVNTVIPKRNVLERRVNSCGVTRYRVKTKLGEEFREGWISARIRGGREEAIVEAAKADPELGEAKETKSFETALDCALVWKEKFDRTVAKSCAIASLELSEIGAFKALVNKGLFKGLSIIESDSLLAAAVSSVSNFSDSGDAVDCSFDEVLAAFEFALSTKRGRTCNTVSANPAANQAATYMLNMVSTEIPSIEALMARAALIRAFNRRARLALPWLSVRPCQEGSAICGGLSGHGASTERSGRSRFAESQELWVQIPSIATRIRSLRGLFFGSVKKGLLQSITEATATPTPLSHDEYELPREIRTVRINRLRSRIAMAGTDNGSKRKYSVFAQLHNETKSWGGAALRRGYVAKGHGGQRRAFKVKLIGEGVNDYSGPYREAFTDAFSEVLNTDTASNLGALGVLDPTPNNSADLGENRDLFMFSLNGRELTSVKSLLGTKVSSEERRIWKSFSSLTSTRDEQSREVEEALVFLGRITGTAFRHGIPVDLPLPLHSVWGPLVEEETKEEDRLRELDELAYRHRTQDELFSLLWWQQRMLNSFVEGMSNVLPVEVLSLLDGVELRDLICGNADVDVDLLRSVVEYEGYVEKDRAIQYFWETLRELSNDERKLFLQFVWARNRLPLKKSDFEAPFKIQRDSANTGERADQALPSASTCFFSLALPEYSSKEILKEKLLFAINNVTTMETDFQTNSVEIQEGYNFRI